MCTLHEDQYTFFIISHSVLLIMRNASDKCCRETQNTYFMLNNFFFKSCCYEMMWKTIVDPGRAHITVWFIHIAYLIPNTHSEYVIVVAFPCQ
jgi:hypothetical protein